MLGFWVVLVEFEFILRDDGGLVLDGSNGNGEKWVDLREIWM